MEQVVVSIGLGPDDVARVKIDHASLVPIPVGLYKLQLGEEAIAGKLRAALTAANLATLQLPLADRRGSEDILEVRPPLGVLAPVGPFAGPHFELELLALSFSTASFVLSATLGSISSSIFLLSSSSVLVRRLVLAVEGAKPLSLRRLQESLVDEVVDGAADPRTVAVELG